MGAPSERIRVVFDCMIFLQGAARRDSPSGLCLLLAEKGLIDLYLSRAILDEIADVLSRPAVRSKFPILTDEIVERFLVTIKGLSTFFADGRANLCTLAILKTSRILTSAAQPRHAISSVAMPICSTSQQRSTAMPLAFVRNAQSLRSLTQ